ncbi:hypothetical protein I4U23_019371 [Adineta vaga]|nr:hypothetical protein I4U23_019371 [Adineta vaga]
MSLSLAANVEYDHLFKIVIIGDSGVGKTSILQRFATEHFSDDYVATIGVDFHIRTIDIDGKRCKLQVWDTAGQDRFRCVVSTFYRGAHGAMICFDMTDKESFYNVDCWLEALERSQPNDIPMLLIGTKCDLQFKRVISYSTAKAYADKRQMTYIETSSKANENIQNCFFDFTRTILIHNNQMKIDDKDGSKSKIKVDLNDQTKPITSGGCMTGYNCII